MLRAPWMTPLVVGLALRVIAALYGYGYFASDDYVWAIEPAWRWLDAPELPYPSPYRSVLLPRLLQHAFALAQAVGLAEPTAMLRFAYLLLGLFSLTAIPAAYALGREENAAVARSAAWLVAAHSILPRICTQALLEVVAMPIVMWAVVMTVNAIRHHRLRHAFFSGLLVGVAAMFRFQAGIVAPVLLAWLFTAHRRSAAAFVAGGGLAAVGQGVIDYYGHGAFLVTPLRYVQFNLAHSSEFGVSPWYATLAIFVLLSMPPATFLLARPFVQACRRHAGVAAVCTVFVGAHMLVAHKEERFMFPILGLFFVLLASALQEARHAGSWSRRAVRWFWSVNAVAVVALTVSDSKRNVTVPLAEIARQYPAPQVAAIAFRPPAFYLGQGGATRTYADVAALAADQNGTARLHAIMLRKEPTPDEQRTIAELGCSPPRQYSGDAIDRLVVWINPKRNARRAPTYVSRCDDSAPRWR